MTVSRRLRTLPIQLLAGLLHALATGPGSAAEAGLKVAVTNEEARFTWGQMAPAEIAIRELPLHTQANLRTETRTLWSGSAAAGRASLPRHDGPRDRARSAKFELFDPTTGAALGPAQFATDFTGANAREHSLKRPAGKKGLACIVDLADCRALGVQHANENIDIAELIDWSTAQPALSFSFEGRKVGLHAPGVRKLDAQIKAKSDLGISIVGILLNYAKKAPGRS